MSLQRMAGKRCSTRWSNSLAGRSRQPVMALKDNSRAWGRLRVLFRSLFRSVGRRPVFPNDPRSVLIAHHLLLGDTLMLAALLKRVRTRWPSARIILTCHPAILPVFAGRPWQVEVVAYDPRQPQTLDRLLAACEGGVDLALLPGENRYALLARACGARWIRALAADHPAWKNLACDELLAWPLQPTALPEIFALLAGEGDVVFNAGDWPAPPVPEGFVPPLSPYAVLHLGAGNPLRYWTPAGWKVLADALAEQKPAGTGKVPSNR